MLQFCYFQMFCSLVARNTNTIKVVLFVNLQLLYVVTVIVYLVGMLFIIQ